jgi:hypothetical protein
MKIHKIEKLLETDKYFITEITFRHNNLFGKKEFTRKCYTTKNNIGTMYYNSGEDIPVRLWEVVKVFLETKVDKAFL